MRQLEPGLHVDASQPTVAALQRFVPRLVWVGGGGGSGDAPNVQRAPSLAAALGVQA